MDGYRIRLQLMESYFICKNVGGAVRLMAMRKLKKYKPTQFAAKGSRYDRDAADFAVAFIESLCHTKGTWAGKPFELIDWQEQIIRDVLSLIHI